jgi:nicotinate-nucleotide adenylyltransferase
MNAPQRIGIFGGTFDPVHLGHLHLAEVAREALGLDQVRFIPCRISPHKDGGTAASGADRLDLLECATRDLAWAVVDDQELRRAEPSFSYLTAAAVAARFPEAKLFWILGGDQWEALPAWKHIGDLARTVEFIVLARGGGLSSPREGIRHHEVAGSHPASATAIRRALAGGATTHRWLPAPVADLIRERRLYRPQGR